MMGPAGSARPRDDGASWRTRNTSKASKVNFFKNLEIAGYADRTA